ncbi:MULTISPECIES: helix-turn-helix domain-containing protein [Streptococcus]|uniref:Helix-turn-helix domain-containing protein n=1 Tax=Streptococcus caledonicus TaxID=2614158 RepID=A0ABW0UB34_9STRE|nr:helix-turn-helix transcriptional regulator [Streptococcus sp. S784/96/1]
MNRLKELRQEKKLSQKELAEKIGVHYRTLQNWENGESQIKPDKAQALADYFGVSVGYLLGYEVIDLMGATDLEDYIFFNGDYSNPDKTRKEYFEKISEKIKTYKKVADSLNGRYNKNKAIEAIELLENNGENDLDDIFEILRDKIELALFRNMVQYQLLSTRFHHPDSKDKILESFKGFE